jgi:hypothetical protein
MVQYRIQKATLVPIRSQLNQAGLETYVTLRNVYALYDEDSLYPRPTLKQMRFFLSTIRNRMLPPTPET